MKRCRPDAPPKASAVTGRECPPWSRVTTSPVPAASSSTALPLAHATRSPCALNAGLARRRLPVTATLLNPAASSAGWGAAAAAAPAAVALVAGRFRLLPATEIAAPSPAALPPLAAPGVVGGGGDAWWSLGLLALLLWLVDATAAPSEASAIALAPPLRVDAGGMME